MVTFIQKICFDNRCRFISQYRKLPDCRSWQDRLLSDTATRWLEDTGAANVAQAHAQRHRRRTAAQLSSRSARGIPHHVAIPTEEVHH